MKLFLNILLLSIFSLTSCTGSKSTSSDSANGKNSNSEELSLEEEREQNILNAGYKKCEIVDMGEKDGCGFIMKDLNADQIYRPVQWEGEFEHFKKDGNIVYVKFRGSKIAQTVCFQSMPVILDEMKLVE